MANQPTVQELQAPITTLQEQDQALQNTTPTTQAAPAATATQVVLTDMPQTLALGIGDLIDYLTKRGQLIYDHRCQH